MLDSLKNVLPRHAFKSYFLSVVVLIFQLPSLYSQKSGDNTIIVKGVSFNSVSNLLLDNGYRIDKSNSELQTLTTEKRQYPAHWNATYTIYVRLKDSVAYFQGNFNAPPAGTLFKDEPVEFSTNKKGEPQSKSLICYPFLLMTDLVNKLQNVEVKFEKR
jgi:hypothetical protein